MKKLLLLILLSQLNIFLKAQYTPMLKTVSEWYVYEYFETRFHFQYKITGESIINNISYKILSIGTSEDPNYLLREDTVLKKVFIRYGEKDFVLYDFSLLPGDTFDVAIGNYSIKLDSVSNQLNYTHIYDMDTLYLKIKNVKVLYFSDNNVWVEGIGSLCGILRNYGAWNRGPIGNYLICHYDGLGIRDYQYLFKDNGGECFGPTYSPELREYESYKIYPNPNIDGYFSCNLNNIQQIQVYNLYGKLLKVMPVSTDTRKFSISELPNGIYVLRIHVGKNVMVTKRIIKM